MLSVLPQTIVDVNGATQIFKIIQQLKHHILISLHKKKQVLHPKNIIVSYYIWKYTNDM